MSTRLVLDRSEGLIFTYRDRDLIKILDRSEVLIKANDQEYVESNPSEGKFKYHFVNRPSTHDLPVLGVSLELDYS